MTTNKKKPFFVRVGYGLGSNPLLAGVVGLLLAVIAFYLMVGEGGVLFVVGFCLLILSLTTFYITLRGLSK